MVPRKRGGQQYLHDGHMLELHDEVTRRAIEGNSMEEPDLIAFAHGLKKRDAQQYGLEACQVPPPEEHSIRHMQEVLDIRKRKNPDAQNEARYLVSKFN